MEIFIKIALVPFLLVSGLFKVNANNIQISSVSVEGRDTVKGTAFVQFTLSWDHSWKDRLHRNWDAAWVFVKTYNPNERVWRHVSLTPPSGTPVQNGANNCHMALPHSIGKANVPVWSEFATSQTDFGTTLHSGVFIYRKDVGNGSNLIEDIRLQFNYKDYNYTNEDLIQVTVFAIEMVYVASHDFFIGDGTSPNALYADGKNLIIKTNVPNGQTALMGKVTSESGWTYQGFPVPDTFPKGKKDFYMMKYEISQHGYADFLNTLNPDQQKYRTSCNPFAAKGTMALVAPGYTSNPLQYRNYVRIKIPAEAETDDYPAKGAIFGHSMTGVNNDDSWAMESNGGNIACNFLSWDDGLAYLDWSCLRPMTEMEYEKACRGNQFLRRGMAWGYQYGIAANPYTITDPGLATEISSNPATCYLETGKAPWVMRVGAFAKDSTMRNEAGASYYGIMELSGNLWERCVNVSTEEGRSFIPRDGDGALNDQTGDAEVEDMINGITCWPSETGGGFRSFQVSNRTWAEATYTNNAKEGKRTPWYGFRGVRYAPAATKFDL
ncbi:MAG: formylglycine-generating enzyme family protein [Bacteroides sp.]|nr:formylglycine-generating enzyme family protein [Bacteroides sp.]MCM1086370.1 formylglycine-generating enzyme family protein [Bacteroides sp.]